MPIKTDREVALETQSKFEFYTLGLVFTLLGLSVQTAKFESGLCGDVLELAGWMSLLSSGLAALWRLEYVPVLRVKMAQKSEYEEESSKLKQILRDGEPKIFVVREGAYKPIEPMVKNRERAVVVLSDVIEKLDRSSAIKYQVHRWGLCLGIVLVGVARAYAGIIAGHLV